MGISGLLPLLKPIQKKTHLSSYEGQTIAVDAYVWLHKGAFACAKELCLNEPTKKYITYCMNKVKMLRSFNIKPLLVFDGGLLPSKLTTEFERASSRSTNRIKAIELYERGKRKEAMDYFQKCVDITPQMAFQLIKALREENVEFIVAPYEADAQLAYLDKIGRVSAIITEDSDLLVYGCKCVIFKLDHQGNGIEVKIEDISKMSSIFLDWSHSQFRQMCILSGCDYLKSIPGVGLKTAHKYFQKYRCFERVIRILRLENSLKIPADYEQKFQRAELTFRHQHVYCPEAMKLIPL
ncbi:PIN domain-like protein, partial [Basidiobolus meristosporus CBS 931.73]